MLLTIRPRHAYAFLGGLYIGKFTNIFSDVVITALVLYIVTPEIFTEDRLTRTKNWVWSWFRPRPVKIELTDLASLQNMPESQKVALLEQHKPASTEVFNFSSLPRIEIIPSPKPT